MLEELKGQVFEANLELVRQGLVISTFGNVSGISREEGLVVIKPSGVPYEVMRPDDMVVLSLEDSKIVEAQLKPSSDTPTHVELYKAFPHIGGIVHTHSCFATAWAQSGRTIPPLGTTHADYFRGAVPCTRPLSNEEIQFAYEQNTGLVICECFKGRDLTEAPGVLVAQHGPFSWGKDPNDAVHNAVLLEYIAKLASETLRINQSLPPISTTLLDKHFLRKHGSGKYYGQN
ncbi:MAG: L-ribulose-5-phosphate 4-epimerase [SAR324 cluster bacterium]|uniref:L-ribulose-5-phosphate 4-epimerase n=1 Tax=SAR324 cluster bacterium TaxID=2024889 RepID=A0A7X9IK83_9DELT|nr:L-ribulose-5-phosphate 4-epimerase [SAR324 cluster bacterium]